MVTLMFENLEVQHAERRAAPRVVDVPAEIVKIVDASWAHQSSEEGAPNAGHIVGPFKSPEEVKVFHDFARAAARQHTPSLKYRALSRVGESKADNQAYFALSPWEDKKAPGKAPAEAADAETLGEPPADSVPEQAAETPGEDTSAEGADKGPAHTRRRRSAK